jgi:hypothetical protein
MDVPRLRWDLHLHPGSAAERRWADGPGMCAAGRAAGVRGFVWKSHVAHTVDLCRAAACDDVAAIPSVILNAWTNQREVMTALEAGGVWLWGPSRDALGALSWDLDLPPWWPEVRARLGHLDHHVVVATAHLGRAGRLELAETAAELESVVCSITHSLYVDVEEAQQLAGLGCAFELDLFTSAFPIKGRPARRLEEQAVALTGTGATVYLTSDAGQIDTGNPFEFTARQIALLASRLATSTVSAMVETGPEAIAAWALKRSGTLA